MQTISRHENKISDKLPSRLGTQMKVKTYNTKSAQRHIPQTQSPTTYYALAYSYFTRQNRHRAPSLSPGAPDTDSAGVAWSAARGACGHAEDVPGGGGITGTRARGGGGGDGGGGITGMRARGGGGGGGLAETVASAGTA